MLRTVQVDVSDTALNHHWYGLSRILSDGDGRPSVLVAGKKQKSTAAVMPEGRWKFIRFKWKLLIIQWRVDETGYRMFALAISIQ